MLTPRLPAWFGVGLVAVLAAAGACGTRRFVRPEGPARPAPDAGAAWAAASASCRGVDSYIGTFALTGRIGERRVRGFASAQLDVAIDAEARLALEARIAGQLVFRLGGDASRAVLWLRDGNRVVEARAAELLAALVGAGVEPDRLREMLAGCPAVAGAPRAAAAYGRTIEADVGTATVFLEPRGTSWQVRAWTFDGWLVTYDRQPGGMPERVTIESASGRTPLVDLSLRVERAERNVQVPPSVFAVAVPDGAEPMSLAQLRASGPLAETETVGGDGPPGP